MSRVEKSIDRWPQSSYKGFMKKINQNNIDGRLAVRAEAKRFLVFAFCLLPFAILSSACRQDMHDNPRYEAYEVGNNRQLPEGSVARGSLALNPSAPKVTVQTAGQPAAAGAMAQTGGTAAAIPTGEDGFPFKFSDNADERKKQMKAVLDRGESRYNISCLPCHGQLGDGNGMIVQRGFKRPPSYHEERLRKAPSSYFYDVMTNGFGAMSSYSDQLTPEDRWKVAAYIRVLQLSQRATLSELGEKVKQDVEKEIQQAAGKKAEGQPAQASGGHSN